MYQPGHPKFSSKLQAVLQNKAPLRIERVALHPRRLPRAAPGASGDRLARQHLEAAGGAARSGQVDFEDFVGTWSLEPMFPELKCVDKCWTSVAQLW